MDTMSFLKMVPAVIGVAGLLTYLMRARRPVSDHGFVNFLLNGRSILLVPGSAALIILSVWLGRNRMLWARCGTLWIMESLSRRGGKRALKLGPGWRRGATPSPGRAWQGSGEAVEKTRTGEYPDETTHNSNYRGACRCGGCIRISFIIKERITTSLSKCPKSS